MDSRSPSHCQNNAVLTMISKGLYPTQLAKIGQDTNCLPSPDHTPPGAITRLTQTLHVIELANSNMRRLLSVVRMSFLNQTSWRHTTSNTKHLASFSSATERSVFLLFLGVLPLLSALRPSSGKPGLQEGPGPRAFHRYFSSSVIWMTKGTSKAFCSHLSRRIWWRNWSKETRNNKNIEKTISSIVQYKLNI